MGTLAGILPGMSNPINTAITEHHNTTRRKQDNEDENNFFSTCNALGSCNFCKGTGNAEGAAGLRKECIATFNEMNKSNNLSYATSPRGAVAAQATDLELQGEGMMVRRRLLNCSTCQGKGTVPRKRKLGPNSIVASKKCPDCTCPRCKGASTKITSTFSYCMDPKYAPSKCKRCEGTGNTGIRARRRLSRGDDEKTTDNPSPPRNEAPDHPVFATNGIGREGFAQLYRQLRAQQQHHLATPASRRAFVELTTNRGPGGNIANVNNDNRGPGG